MIYEAFVIDGHAIPRSRLPNILVGNKIALAYVHNPKSGCTLARQILFYLNHGYHYNAKSNIHDSSFAFWKIQNPPTSHHEAAIAKFNQLDAKLFTFVRDPIERFLSAFYDKIWQVNDTEFAWIRDNLTCNFDVDFSVSSNLQKACTGFVSYMTKHVNPIDMEHHFRPQFLNLAQDVKFPKITILQLENQAKCIKFFKKYVDHHQSEEFFLKKTNASGRDPNLRNLLSPAVVAQLKEYYKEDYKNFY